MRTLKTLEAGDVQFLNKFKMLTKIDGITRVEGFDNIKAVYRPTNPEYADLRLVHLDACCKRGTKNSEFKTVVGSKARADIYTKLANNLNLAIPEALTMDVTPLLDATSNRMIGIEVASIFIHCSTKDKSKVQNIIPSMLNFENHYIFNSPVDCTLTLLQDVYRYHVCRVVQILADVGAEISLQEPKDVGTRLSKIVFDSNNTDMEIEGELLYLPELYVADGRSQRHIIGLKENPHKVLVTTLLDGEVRIYVKHDTDKGEVVAQHRFKIFGGAVVDYRIVTPYGCVDANMEIKPNKIGDEVTVNLYHDRKLLATVGSVVAK